MNINNSCALILGAQPIFSFYCDYFTQRSGTNYSLRGGGSNDGAICGIFYIVIYYSSSAASWRSGASLSFKLYILFLSK